MKLRRWSLLVWLALALPVCAQEEVRVPNGIDLSRLKKVDAQAVAGLGSGRAHRLTVYATMTAIDNKDARLLFPQHVGKGFGTREQLLQRFKTTVSATNRFDFRDERQTDVMEGIVVEGMITAANQNLEDYRAFLKSVTTVRMSLSVKDLETGEVLRSKNLSAIYGAEDRDGTIVKSRDAIRIGPGGACRDPDVCANLENDYEKALRELLESAAAYLEKTFRPIAKVIDVDGEDITMLGSTNHGFNVEEELVVFRARPLKNEDGKPLPPAIKAIALVGCSVGDILSCRATHKGRNGDVQTGDYAVPSDRMLKLLEN